MSGGHKGLFIGKGYVVPRLYRFYCRYYPEHSHDRRHHYISFGNNCGSHKPLHSETYFIFKIGGKKLKVWVPIEPVEPKTDIFFIKNHQITV